MCPKPLRPQRFVPPPPQPLYVVHHHPHCPHRSPPSLLCHCPLCDCSHLAVLGSGAQTPSAPTALTVSALPTLRRHHPPTTHRLLYHCPHLAALGSVSAIISLSIFRGFQCVPKPPPPPPPAPPSALRPPPCAPPQLYVLTTITLTAPPPLTAFTPLTLSLPGRPWFGLCHCPHLAALGSGAQTPSAPTALTAPCEFAVEKLCTTSLGTMAEIGCDPASLSTCPYLEFCFQRLLPSLDSHLSAFGVGGTGGSP